MKKLLFLIFVIAECQTNYAQVFGLQFGVGTSHYLGDLGGKPTYGTDGPTDLDWQTTRYVLNTGLRVNISPTFAIRLAGSYGRLAGDDKYTTNLERKNRNLNFYSHLAEGSLTMQANLGKSKRLYIFGGVGYFTFNPKTKFGNSVYELQKYGTEGQYHNPDKAPYALNALSFPFGFGYKLAATKNGYFSLEFSFRKTTTDYIDDVSTTYADPTLLAASNGPIAVQLSNRSLSSSIPGFSEPGAIRGNSGSNDNFSFLTINYILQIGVKNYGAGFGSGRKHRGRRGKGSCPDMTF